MMDNIDEEIERAEKYDKQMATESERTAASVRRNRAWLNVLYICRRYEFDVGWECEQAVRDEVELLRDALHGMLAGITPETINAAYAALKQEKDDG